MKRGIIKNAQHRLCLSKRVVKMNSIRELYRIGKGPSSSHTIGPENACKLFKAENPDADFFVAVLYGSLALTGEGHGTDSVIQSVLPSVSLF